MDQNYFKHKPLAQSEYNQTENLAIEVEEAFLNVEDTLWNNNKASASIGSSIGNLDTWYLKEYSPNNGMLLNYTQDLEFEQYSKEASLDLVPDTATASLNSVTIKNKIIPEQIYTYKHNGQLESDTDFCFVGRKLVLKEQPIHNRSLSITYNGYQPLDTYNHGIDLKYNVLQFTIDNTTTKSFTPTKTNNTWTISGYDFLGACTNVIKEIVNNHPYDLPKFVVVYNEETEEKYSIFNISITATSFSFESYDDIQAPIKIYIANSTLSALIEGLYRLFYSHDHSVDGGTLVNHKALTGLFNNDDRIKYSATSKENYDHPQYLNREGYIEDPSVYNNALLGDLLISSRGSSNYFNNLSSHSFKLIFGEYASGHRLSYDSEADVLVLDSLSRDGLKISSPKEANILSLNDHTIVDTVDGDFSGVRLSIVPTEVGSKDVAVFSIQRSLVTDTGTDYEDSAELHVYSSTFSLTKIKGELNLTDDAVLTLGSDKDIKLSSDDKGITLENTTNLDKALHVTLPIEATQIHTKHLDADYIHISDAQMLTFEGGSHSDENPVQYLKYNSAKEEVQLATKKPLALQNNGFNSGIAFASNNKIFLSNPQGTHTSNVSETLDTYVQGNGSMYLVQYDPNYVVGNAIKRENRLNLYAGDLHGHNMVINYSEDSVKGVKLNGNTHTIFAQRDLNGVVSTNILSTGNVNILNGYVLSNGTPTLGYGIIKAAEFRVEGTSPTAGIYGNVIVPLGSTLTVNGQTSFNSGLTLNNGITVKGVASLSETTTGNLTAASVTTTGSLVTNSIVAPIGLNSTIYVGSDTTFNNVTEFKQAARFTGNCTFSGNIEAYNIKTSFLSVDSDVTFSNLTAGDVTVSNRLQFKSMLQTDMNATSEFAGEVNLRKGATLDKNARLLLGSSDIEFTRNTVGTLLKENTLTMGVNSTVKANKIFANKGVPNGGNGDIVGGYAFETINGATDGDTGMFCSNRGTSALVDDLQFYINGEKKGELRYSAVDMTAAGSEKVLVTVEMLKAFTAPDGNAVNPLNQFYPVGSVYMNADDNRNPREIFNWPESVWTRHAVGMTIVGAEGTTNAEKVPTQFNKPASVQTGTLGATFGTYQHTLTQEELPSHNHEFPGDDMLGRGFGAQLAREQRGYDASSSLGKNMDGAGWYYTSETGGNKAHNNVQPSITVAVWKRVG